MADFRERITTEDLKQGKFIVGDEEGKRYELGSRLVSVSSTSPPKTHLTVIGAKIIIRECEVGKNLDVYYLGDDDEEKPIISDLPVKSIEFKGEKGTR